MTSTAQAVDPRAVGFDGAGASGVMRPLRSGHDDLRWRIIQRRLNEGLAEMGGEWAVYAGYKVSESYAKMCVCAEACEGIAFPSMTDTPRHIAGEFADWLQRDESVFSATMLALDQANAPLNDPALVPPSALSDEKKQRSPKKERQSESA